jgi:hypothetical protein
MRGLPVPVSDGSARLPVPTEAAAVARVTAPKIRDPARWTNAHVIVQPSPFADIPTFSRNSFQPAHVHVSTADPDGNGPAAEGLMPWSFRFPASRFFT